MMNVGPVERAADSTAIHPSSRVGITATRKGSCIYLSGAVLDPK